ncbi:MAG: VWA domain-containing protein [Acidobacteria bacterium]|nr:VWA domain-containing protein [Acidobacteriota bacterium]
MICTAFILCLSASGQDVVRDLKLSAGGHVEVVNHFGRVTVKAMPPAKEGEIFGGKLTAVSPKGLTDNEIKFTAGKGGILIVVTPNDPKKRVDIELTLPNRSSVKIETTGGAVDVMGDLEKVEVFTDTGTIATDVPDDDITYNFHWTESRPRYLADFDIAEVKEKSGGRFDIRGRWGEGEKRRKGDKEKVIKEGEQTVPSEVQRAKTDAPRPVTLNFTTARGIILLNVPPSEVGSDLRERPLTNAAKAIVRSGDSLLMEAIRRAAPKYYGDYMRSLPPIKLEPRFSAKTTPADLPTATLKRATVRVTDLENRAIAGLRAEDFEISESGAGREIVSVEQSTAPFNLVLLLDVSGSVENYVTFIRKAARSFVDTVDAKDKVSLVIFNDDVKVLSRFTTDKGKLSESLDTFDAGGGTAYYDALAFTIADTLRPLKGERTAIVILTDGDDNRSFLAFDSLAGSIQESGALIYPLYVPSGLIAMAAQGVNADIDPMRKKYMSLSAKSSGEGERFAKISGGVYYPITRIEQIQQAYRDIAVQLRTAYVITFRSELAATPATASRPA